METGGVDALPNFVKDTTDRNRTSPFAFTGNKFEFRMPGSSLSVSGPNFMLNTAVAEALEQFADELEGVDADKLGDAVNDLLSRTIKEHKRIIFNGNNYSEEWVKEAEKRGLLNNRTAPEALPAFIAEKNLRLFEKHHILTRGEAYSRYEINLDNYSKVINIEGLTMLEMVRRDIIPAVTEYIKRLSEETDAKSSVCPLAVNDMELTLIAKLSELNSELFAHAEQLEINLTEARNEADKQKQAELCCDMVLPKMDEVRAAADTLEKYMPKDMWPMPTYGDLLFSIG